MYKNTASQYLSFAMISATDGSALTGLTPSVYVTKDGGSQASGAGTVSELGNGFYRYAPTQSETNADSISFGFTGAGAVPVNLQVYTDDLSVVRVANLTQIDGNATSGNNATLNLKQLNIINNNGDAFYAQSTGSNGRGFHVIGHGTSSGVRIVGGSTGNGIMVVGGSTSGNGVQITTTNGHGIISTGSGTNNGFRIEAGSTASALRIVGGTTSGQGIHITTTNGDGILCAPAGGNSHAVNFVGVNNGAGLRIVGGATGVGLIISATGQSTVSITNTGASTTFAVANTGTGPAASFVSTVSNGLTINSGGNANALSISAAGGSGSGIGIRGGTLGGNGIMITTFDGHGISMDITGAGKYDIDADVSVNQINRTSIDSNVADNVNQFFDVSPTTTKTVDDVGTGGGGGSTGPQILLIRSV